MRRTIGSRFLSVFLAIVLLLSSVNVTVFAEAQENAGDGTESTIETTTAGSGFYLLPAVVVYLEIQ